VAAIQKEHDESHQTNLSPCAHVASDGARRLLVRRLDVGSARSDLKLDEYILFGATTARATDTPTGFRLRGG